MDSKVYSFTLGQMIQVTSAEQLNMLVEERRQRGMSENRLAEFSAWHVARLSQNSDS